MFSTTTNAVEGRPVREYLGIVTGEVIVGANLFRDLFASITDIVGGRSGKYEDVLARARKEAIGEMEAEAAKLGGNAVIGVDLDYEVLGQNGSMLMVSASGTAVTLGVSVDIRPATSADAARCAEIYAPYVTDNWVSFERDPPGVAEMARRIEVYGTSHGWLVAKVEGKIAGYAYGSPHRTREAYATSADVAIYLDTAFARAGVGRRLYEALFPILKRRNVHAIFAGIALPNEASVGLHEVMGFTPIGIYREVGWKMGGWRDVGWWQRLL